MLENAWGSSPGPHELPTDISPFQISIMSGLTIVVLTMIERHPSATVIRKSWGKKGVITCKTWKLHSAPGGHTARLRGERESAREIERASAPGWGVSVFLGVGCSARVSTYSLLVNLKHKSRN